MILDVDESRLLVVSDLHVGTPVSDAASSLPGFIGWAGAEGWNLCINGDGVDLIQSSIPRLVADGIRLVRELRQFMEGGGRLYYVLGNHDLVFEHVLADLPIVVSPFLNVRSGGSLVRIEHGHVHEPGFVRAPGFYELAGRAAKPFLFLHADSYRAYSRVQREVHRVRRRRRHGGYPTHLAADALFERGFDTVIFGHTHLPEHTLRPLGTFVNCGDWMTNRTYAAIHQGVVTLHRWGEGGPEPAVGPTGALGGSSAPDR